MTNPRSATTAASMAYERELEVAKKAATLAASLCKVTFFAILCNLGVF